MASEAATLAARIEDRRLSLRLSSLCRSRIAASMDEVRDSFSAVASSWAMLLARELARDRTLGDGWTRAVLLVEAVRRGFGVRMGVVE